MKRLIVCAALALAACGPKTAETPKAPETAAAQPPNAATLKAYAAQAQGENEIDNAANVAKVIHLDREGAKLYSLVGGDPAINGEYVVLGLYVHPDGWSTYRIGDFNTWELAEQSADTVVLKVSHSAVEEGSGEIVNYDQKIAIALPPVIAEGAEWPQQVQVTPVD